MHSYDIIQETPDSNVLSSIEFPHTPRLIELLFAKLGP